MEIYKRKEEKIKYTEEHIYKKKHPKKHKKTMQRTYKREKLPIVKKTKTKQKITCNNYAT